MSQVIYDDLSLKKFLRLPEAKPALEYFEGKVVQKVAPKRAHSVIHTMIAIELGGFVRKRRLGQVYIELRCTFAGASLVPDICFFAAERLPKEEDVVSPPHMVVEIISPAQTVKDLTRRLDWFVDEGVRLGWLIQPRQKRAIVFQPGAEPQELGAEDTLDGGDVVPGYRLAIREMLGWLE
jgi:Uma2 family endonuclease